jgi:hypothetical protein
MALFPTILASALLWAWEFHHPFTRSDRPARPLRTHLVQPWRHEHGDPSTRLRLAYYGKVMPREINARPYHATLRKLRELA